MFVQLPKNNDEIQFMLFIGVYFLLDIQTEFENTCFYNILSYTYHMHFLQMLNVLSFKVLHILIKKEKIWM